MNKTSLGSTTVTMSDVEDIVRRIVGGRTEPDHDILFGSAARGEMGPHSDLEFLIIKSGAHRRRLSVEIRHSLYGIAASLDIVVATPEDIKRYKDSFALVYKPGLREGTVFYDAAHASAGRAGRV